MEQLEQQIHIVILEPEAGFMGFREVIVRTSCDIFIQLSLDVIDGRIRDRTNEQPGTRKSAEAIGTLPPLVANTYCMWEELRYL